MFLLCLQDLQLIIEENPHVWYLKLFLKHFRTQAPVPPQGRERKANVRPLPHLLPPKEGANGRQSPKLRFWLATGQVPSSERTAPLPPRRARAEHYLCF